MTIRTASIEDLEPIDAIYNQAVLEQKVADLAPWTDERRRSWFREHSGGPYPLYIAEIDNTVAGYGSVSPYRPGRMAVRQTAELSYFVDEKYRRRGIGRALIAFIESQCAQLQIKTLFAIILDHNEGSIKLIENCGYSQWGHLPRVARFGTEERGHVYYGKRIIP